MVWPFKKNIEKVVGSEIDDNLIAILASVLKKCGAILDEKKNIVVGSQDVLWAVYIIGEEKLTVRSETFEGISLKGPESLVNEIDMIIQRELRSGLGK